MIGTLKNVTADDEVTYRCELEFDGDGQLFSYHTGVRLPSRCIRNQNLIFRMSIIHSILKLMLNQVSLFEYVVEIRAQVICCSVNIYTNNLCLNQGYSFFYLFKLIFSSRIIYSTLFYNIDLKHTKNLKNKDLVV